MDSAAKFDKFNCADCSKPCGIFMVKGWVWETIVPAVLRKRILCCHCFSIRCDRIGYPLSIDDLMECPGNEPILFFVSLVRGDG